MVKIVKDLNSRQTLVEEDGKYFVVSQSREDMPLEIETLVFPADADGNITSWSEEGGARGIGKDEYLKRVLSSELVSPWRYEY